MTDPGISVVTDASRMAGMWSDRSYLDQGLPYPPEMAAAPTSTPLNNSRRSRRSWFERRPATNFEIKVESPENLELEKPVRKKRRESEEPEVLTLTHFTAPPRIGFGKMKPGEIKDRTLLLRNPHECEQTVKVEKVPEKKSFSVDSRLIAVPPGETCPLTITWEPKEEGNFREMILMQVDKSYRLQAYVFGSVVAPPKKKKARKGGLLSTKVSRPFAVIHTASLSNIDRSYSPEKHNIMERPQITKKAVKGKERASGDYKRRSPRLSGNKIMDTKTDVKNIKKSSKDKSDQENRNSNEKAGLKKPLPRATNDEKIPKKKMRRSNTYSNVSGLGLMVPVINNETVQVHTSTKGNAQILKEQIDMCNISGFEIIDTQTPCDQGDKKQTVSELPSFLKAENKSCSEKNEIEDDNSFVEVDSLEMDHKKGHALNEKYLDIEDSFVEIKSETFVPEVDLKKTHKINEKTEKGETGNGSDILVSGAVKSPNSPPIVSKQGINKLLKNPALSHINKENSFLDSLDETPDAVEPPSFLSPESFVDDSIKYKLRSARKGKKYIEKDCPSNVVNLTNHLNNSRPVISPDTFVKETSSAKKSVLKNRNQAIHPVEPSPETILNESIPHDVVIHQLESVKANLHEQSFESDIEQVVEVRDLLLTKENDGSEKEVLDRRETFIKKSSSPRFSVPATEVDFRSGTFVGGAKKVKLLEKQQPSGASPRRTTFTVLKKTYVNALKTRPRARSDETPRNQRRRTRSQTKILLEHEASNKVSTGIEAKEETGSVERSTKMCSETITKKKCESVERVQSSTSHRLFSKDTVDDKEIFEVEFKTASELTLAQANYVSEQYALTVTKSRPSDALMNNVRQIGSASSCLFSENCSKSVSESDKHMGSLNENEEDSLETSQASSKNSTYEVSANKSILLNQIGLKNDSFPSTPQQLPNSPNPDHSRRSTHVVEKPKVLDLSRADRKQLFPGIVDYEDDSAEDKSSSQNENDKGDIQNEAHLNNGVKDDDSLTKSNSRRRVSARKSVKRGVESTDSIKDQSVHEEIKTENATAKISSDIRDKPELNKKDMKLENTDSEQEIEETGQLSFVPVDNKPVKEIAKAVRTGPHLFLKKRSNTVVQNEDRKQAKRIKSDSDSLVTKTVMAKREPKAEKPQSAGARVTHSRIKAIGGSTERLERQVLKPKVPLKGVTQSKLILMKKTKTALPKHPLPFAAKNMYYDERWMEKQERGFVNWLNFILTPAEEYQSNEVKVKVDAGKLAVDVAKGNVKLAPTNEVLSFRAYSAHRKLNRLRKSACRLFQSEEVVKVVQKLEAEVESKRLRVRKDKMMHADLGVKQRILDMLLSYNPLWLRIGLETIYGEVLPVQSNSDVFGLSRFILTRLLNSPEIAEEYAHPTVPHLYREGYAAVVAQHTLKKFMMLVYFLDKAKLGRLIEHNPCLFCKDSEFKASKDFLLQFSRDYLSGEGDITRHLGYLGYKVGYTQTALDEFDFAVTKLAVDLRDGLRLTRAMEFLSNKLELSRTLRVPAISRLQKIHNVEVVFKTLEEQGIKTDKVTTRDVVDGHREKTLQLLWTIILHYQVELLLNEDQLKEEIAILQKSLKVKCQLEKLLAYDQRPLRESCEPDLHTQNPRLNLLLKWCRTVCAFYNIKVENFTVSFSDGRALCYIVHHYHPGLLPAAVIHSETTVTHLEDMEKKTQQRLASSFNDSSSAAFGDVEDPEVFEQLLNNEKENFKLLFKKVKELGGIPLMLKWSDMSNTIPDEKVVMTYLLYLCARLLDIRHESRAARVIQLAWRKYRLGKIEKELHVKNQAAKVIQSVVRKYLAVRRLARQELSAICIQRVWRGRQGRQLARKMREEKALAEQMQAVLTLQKSIKQYLYRRRYLQRKQSVMLLQAHCRGYLHRQGVSAAATTIQKWVRGHRVRTQLKRERRSAVVIQAHIRACLVRRELQKLHKAASKIQTAYRAHQAMKVEQLNFCRMKDSAVVIQRRFRAYQIRMHFLKIKNSAIKLQAVSKSNIQRKKFLNTKNAVVVLQSHIRLYLVAKQQQAQYKLMRRAAISIQASWRMFRERLKYSLARKSATKIQASLRMYLERKWFEKLKTAVVKVQRRYRAKIQAVADRQDFLVKKGATMTIQAFFRGHRVRKEIRKMTHATVQIQSTFKGYLQRKRYIAVKQAAVTVQRQWRAKICGLRERMKYLAMKNAAVKIQSGFRGYMVKKEYRLTRQKIILVQTCVRAHQQRLKFQKHKQAAVVIQRKWLAEIVARQQAASFQRIRTAIICLQSTVRMAQQMKKYNRTRGAAIMVQSFVRMSLQRLKYQKVRRAVLVLQRRFRARLEGQKCRQKHLITLGAIMTIQSTYRGYCARREMLMKRNATIKIQAQIRGYLQRKMFEKLKAAALTCQRLYRAKQEGQKCRQQYLIILGAAITIQSVYRGYCAKKQFKQKRRAVVKIQSHVRQYLQRSRFLRMKTAAVVFQKYYRGKLVGRQRRGEFLKYRKAVVTVQSLYRRNKYRKQFLSDKARILRLQTCVRRYLVRKRYLKIQASACIIQRRWRQTLVARQQRSELEMLKKAAILVQATLRMKLQRRKFLHVREAAVKIQSVGRMIQKRKCINNLKAATQTIQKYYRAKRVADKCRQDFLVAKGAAITIQALIKGHLVRKELKRKNKAATMMQSFYRGHRERSKFVQLKQVTVCCQRLFRAKLLGHKVQQDYETVKKGVIALQAVVRGQAERTRYLKLKNAAIVIQSHFHGNKTRSQLKKLKQAALVVQRQFRANQVAKQYVSMKRAAIKVQSWVRMTNTRKGYLKTINSIVKLQSCVRMISARYAYLCKRSSAVKIQQWFRGSRETKLLQYEFLVFRGAAITIQAAIKGFLARRGYRRNLAARKMQAVYRGHRERIKYQSIRRSIIVVQSRVRAYLGLKQVKELRNRHKAAILIQQKWCAMRKCRKEREDYLKRKQAVSVCQSVYRARLMMLEARRDFIRCKQAAVTIQASLRGSLVRKQLKTRNSAAVVLQSVLRSHMERKRFLQLRNATLVCQVRLRAKSLGKRQRTSFLNLRKVVIRLQAIRRGTLCKRDYVQQRNAAVIIQSCVRGYLKRKHLAQVRWAAVVLQRRWRARQQCRQTISQYQKLRNAAVTLQSVCRGNKAREMFSRMKGAIRIQAWWKMVCARRNYCTKQAAVVRIQAQLKSWKARKEFLAVRELRRRQRVAYLSRVAMVTRVNMAAIRVQRCYRNYMVTKLAKQRLHSVILLQRWIKSKLVRLQYLRTRGMICHLQETIRTWLSQRQTAVKVIQRAARKWLANKHVRQENRAAIKIQALWRGYSLRSKTKSKRLTLVRQRVEEANAAATEDKKLGNRTSSALDYLLKYKNMSSVLDALKHLDVATRLSPVCCERMVEVNALSVLYQLLNSCNRSLPHMEIIKYTVSILLNLAKYEKTRPAVYSEEGGILTIVELMQVYREKKGDIFPKACTLLGIVALDYTCKTFLLKDKKLVERLRSIHSLTARKHKLEENQRITRARMNATFNTTLSVRSPVKRHKIKPDWSLHRDKLSDFENPLKAETRSPSHNFSVVKKTFQKCKTNKMACVSSEDSDNLLEDIQQDSDQPENLRSLFWVFGYPWSKYPVKTDQTAEGYADLRFAGHTSLYMCAPATFFFPSLSFPTFFSVLV